MVHRLADLVSEGIGAGRIAPLLGEKRQHRLHHLRRDPRGGVVVEIINRTVAHGHNPHATRLQENGELNRVSPSKSKLFRGNVKSEAENLRVRRDQGANFPFQLFTQEVIVGIVIDRRSTHFPCGFEG